MNKIDFKYEQRNNQPKGEKHYSARFTEDDIRTIRKLKEDGKTNAEIAMMYKTYAATINQIVLRKTWKHI